VSQQWDTLTFCHAAGRIALYADRLTVKGCFLGIKRPQQPPTAPLYAVTVYDKNLHHPCIALPLKGISIHGAGNPPTPSQKIFTPPGNNYTILHTSSRHRTYTLQQRKPHSRRRACTSTTANPNSRRRALTNTIINTNSRRRECITPYRKTTSRRRE